MARNREYRNTLVILMLRFMELTMQIMVFALILMLVLIGFFGRENDSAVRCLAVMGIPCVILYIVRGWCKSRVVTTAAHVLSFLYAIIITADSTERVAYIAVITGLIIYSGLLILNEKVNQGEQIPVGMIALFVGGMFVGLLTERKTIEEWSLYFGIAFILIQVFYHNLNNMNAIMLMNREISNFPAASMVSVNFFIMSVVGILCVGAMVLVNNQYVYRMMDGIGSIFVILLRYIFKLLQHSDENEVVTEELITKEPDMQSNEFILEEIKTGLFQDILNGIAMVLGVVLSVAIIICLVAALVRLLRRFKGAGIPGGDIKEFIAPEEISTFPVKHRKTEHEYIAGSNNAKARKLYKSIVKKAAVKKGRTITDSMMPGEISGQFIAYNTEEATSIYERARYSNTEVTGSDIEILKKLKKMQKKG